MKSQQNHSGEQALKVSGADRGSGRGRGRNSSRGRGRGRQNKESVHCYKCHKFGLYQNKCPKWEHVNFCEINEDKEILLMADKNSDGGNIPRKKCAILIQDVAIT
jgi:hypothetical protein